MERNRALILSGLLAFLLILSYYVLAAVVQVIVFAITVAYVLFPVRERLRNRGFSRRLASAITTFGTFLLVIVLFVPIAFALFRRSNTLVEKLAELPETIRIEFAGLEYAVDVAAVFEVVEEIAQDIAVETAISAPALALALVLFTFVLYGVLYRPRAARDAIYGAVPAPHHDIIDRLHTRTKRVLFALYVIQAVTAAATFVIALILFVTLGYTAPVWLALGAAVLQFIPMLGPSLLVVSLVAADIVIFGEPVRGVLLLVFGLLFISLFPDATIRPKLAKHTGDFSATLYFVGFVGGLLTLGAIGVIVGPLVVALLVETVAILAQENDSSEN